MGGGKTLNYKPKGRLRVQFSLLLIFSHRHETEKKSFFLQLYIWGIGINCLSSSSSAMVQLGPSSNPTPKNALRGGGRFQLTTWVAATAAAIASTTVHSQSWAQLLGGTIGP